MAKLADGSLDAGEIDRLRKVLAGNAEAQRYYCGYLDLHEELGQRVEPVELTMVSPGTIETKPAAAWMPSWRVRTISFAVVAAVFYGVFAAIAWNLRPDNFRLGEPYELVAVRKADATTVKPAFVATLTSTTNCDWRVGQSSLQAGTKLPVGELELLAGKAEVAFTSGATVTLEGPARFALEHASGGRLDHGKLWANVPSRARGFSVQTPTAKIIDLGTEFEVEVSEAGTTNVHVLQGTVEVEQANVKVKGNPANAVRLMAGQSARVDAIGSSTFTTTPQTAAFLRNAKANNRPVDLDLADIVAGGDGRGHRRGFGIDPTSGRLLLTPDSDNSRIQYFPGDGKYHRVSDRPFIDGVTIPDAGRGPVQLNSAGQTFAGFPDTNNRTYAPVWAGALPLAPNEGSIPTTFDGKLDYAVSPHSVIVFHPNKLITFDLAAIRRVHRKQMPVAFQAVVGLSKPTTEADHLGSADFWVFVDGEMQFSRRAMSSADAPQSVDVPLAKSSRFLTLAATDGGDDFSWDWLILGDPHLKTASASTATASPSDVSPKGESISD